MGARETDFQEYTVFPGMTYQTGLGPVSPITVNTTVAANTTVIAEVVLGGAIGVATFRTSVDGGAFSAPAATAGSNGIATTGLVITWGGGSNLVLGTRYTWTNVPVRLNTHRETSDHETLKLEFVDVEAVASLGVTTKRSGENTRTLTGLVDGKEVSLNVYSITSAVGVNKLRVFWGDH